MPVRQEYDKSARGLYGQYNHTSGVPQGGVLEARNCVVDRQGILSKRRGFNRHGSELQGHPSAMFEYDDTLIALDGATLKYDSDGAGTWAEWEGGFSNPDATHKMRGIEKLRNIYFSTNDGIYKNDSLTGVPVRAGMPEGLDIKLTSSGSNGWFTGGRQVGYRMIWSREDANENLILSSPSYSYEISNPIHVVTLSNEDLPIGVVRDVAHGFETGDIVAIETTAEVVMGYDRTSAVISVVDDDSYRYELAVASIEPLESIPGTVKLNRAKVTVEFSVPDGISVEKGDKYEIYRTKMQPLAAEVGFDPGTGDDLFRVVKKEITAEELAAKKVSYDDEVYEISLEALGLYTNAIRETISQSNDKPPYCKDIALFKDYLFAANLRYRHQLEIHLKTEVAFNQGTEEPVMELGDTITITVDGVGHAYKLASSENVSAREFLLSTQESTPAVNVRKTMQSLVRVINQHPSDTGLYAHYSSLAHDAPGKVLLMARKLEIGAFQVTASSDAFGAMFEPKLPTSGNEAQSKDSEGKNQIAYSKVNEPEAFPFINVFSIGSEEHDIHRIIPLRDSLIILKSDGIFRLTGETANSFVIRDLDRTAHVTAPEGAVALNNAVFCMSTGGIIRVDENGTQAISWAIDDEIGRVKDFPGQTASSFAVAYETDRKFIFWAPEASGALLASKAWVYNYLTKEWTTWMKPAVCGHVMRSQDKLYIAHAEDKYILQERKTPGSSDNLEDYMDETIGTRMTAYSTTTDADGKTVSTVTISPVSQDLTHTTQPYKPAWDYPRELRAGFLFSTTAESVTGGDNQTVTRRSKIASVSIATTGVLPALTYTATLTLKDDLGFSASADRPVEISLPIDSYVRWAPDDGGQLAVMKHYTYAMLSMEENKALAHELGFYTDVVPQKEWVNTINLVAPTGWGQGPWGSDPWGDNDIRSTPLVTSIPRQHQRCRALTFLYRHRTAMEKFDIQAKSLSFRPYGGKIVRKSV